MGVKGSVWECMGVHGSAWECMGVHGSVWSQAGKRFLERSSARLLGASDGMRPSQKITRALRLRELHGVLKALRVPRFLACKMAVGV